MRTSLIYYPIPGAPPPSAGEIGGKAHNLARLAALGVETPRWIVLTAAAFDAALNAANAATQTTADATVLQHAIRTQELPADFEDEVLGALVPANLLKVPLAVRSSAVVEDAAAASYAGQFDSRLNVRGDALWDAIRRVWASALNAHAAAYARSTPSSSLPPSLPLPQMAVILQEMVVPAVSGVAFTADPLTGARDTVVISAVYGLGEGLVSGELDADTYWLSFPGQETTGNTASATTGGDKEGDALTPPPAARVPGSPKSWERGDLGGDLARPPHNEASQSPLAQPLGEPGTRAAGGGVRASPSSHPSDPRPPTPDPALRRTLARKERALRPDPAGGTRWEPVPAALQEAPALTEAEVRKIADVARRLAEGLGAPQDVEWALVGRQRSRRRLVILQSRPITALPGGDALTPGPSPKGWARGDLRGDLARLPHNEASQSPLAQPLGEGPGVRARPDDPAAAASPTPGERRLWDNSNIIESYGGVTTPLTFSFVRSVYEDAYRQFCRLLGVSEALLDEHRQVFAHMLGLIQGRVYYNLLNWYRALALLPGYSLNRAFMERMMGVRQKLADPPPAPYVAGRGEDALRLARMIGRLFREHRRLPREVVAFHARVEAALAPLAREDLTTWPTDKLAALYQRLEGELLRQWRAPLVNDFLAMIAFGILGRLVEKWLPEAPPTLLNDLLCGEGDIISTEPARRVMALAGRVAASPALTACFAAEPDDTALWRHITAAPELQPFHAEMRAYLDRFGDRCAHELKLETVTLGEQPDLLLQLVRAYVAGGHFDAEASRERERRIRADAEALVRARLHGLRRRAFRAVLRQTRHRVRDRENLRFERTRAFGLARRIFLALGTHLAARGRLAAPRDIFYLTKEEILNHLDGVGVTTDLAALATLRRDEFAAHERAPAPPDRFETFGPPADESGRSGVQAFRRSGDDRPSTADERPPARTPERPNARTPALVGTGCCPGLVKAPVRVIRDPREAHDLAGHILVAERTDPGWTLLFPIVRGLLVQRGSLLSHSAIVAREMGLPCVVGIADLLEMLKDGDWVEMDGTTGEVRVMRDA